MRVVAFLLVGIFLIVLQTTFLQLLPVVLRIRCTMFQLIRAMLQLKVSVRHDSIVYHCTALGIPI